MNTAEGDSIPRHPFHDIAVSAVAAAAILACYSDIALGLARQWASDGNNSYGFLVPPLTAYFIWQRRHALASARPHPSLWGAGVVMVGLSMHLVGAAAADLFVMRLSVIPVLAGSVWFLFGLDHLRVLRFPVFFLALMIPLPSVVFNQITVQLQLIASQIGEVTLRGAGIPVLRDGNILELVGMRLEVAEACSGIRSLCSLLVFAVAFGAANDFSPQRIALLAGAAVPLAIAANAARVAGTGIAAHAWGPSVAEGVLHGISGAMVFGIAAGTMILLAQLWPGDKEGRL